MISMKDAVIQSRVQANAETPPLKQASTSETRYKTKLLEEFTDYTNVGSGIWGAWVCPF
jgi:hypothetical protein